MILEKTNKNKKTNKLESILNLPKIFTKINVNLFGVFKSGSKIKSTKGIVVNTELAKITTSMQKK